MLDIQMPAKDGLVVLREMRNENLPTRVVVLTATLDEEGLTEAVRLGVRGLVLKELAPSFSCNASGKCTRANCGWRSAR